MTPSALLADPRVTTTGRSDHGPTTPAVGSDQLAARRTFYAQIARLERDLGATLTLIMTDGISGQHVNQRPRAATTGRLLSLADLESTRDSLVMKLHRARTASAARSAAQEDARRQLERMLADPPRHKFVRVTCSELGDPGCGAWEVRPRLGLLGMLAGWWEVKLSSGCPLPR